MNQQAMLKKVRQMQQDIAKTQQEIEETLFEETNNGLVKVVLKGNKELVEVVISPEYKIESEEDTEMLGAMVVAACAKAYRNIEKTTEEKMAKYQAFLQSMGSFM